MDTASFLLNRNEILRRMHTRTHSTVLPAHSQWGWLTETLTGGLKVMSKLSGGSLFESWVPKMLLPQAAPLVGAAFGYVKQKGLPFTGGKKPFWTKFVPFL
jgi:hypothetical protein